MLNIPVNSYGHVGTVSSSNFFSLTKRLTSSSCTYFRFSLTTTLLETAKGRRFSRRNYFMINLQESMVPGPDQTQATWNLQSDTYLHLDTLLTAIKLFCLYLVQHILVFSGRHNITYNASIVKNCILCKHVVCISIYHIKNNSY